jgi:hypothetical protein
LCKVTVVVVEKVCFPNGDNVTSVWDGTYKLHGIKNSHLPPVSIKEE